MIENIKTITETEAEENGVCSAPDILTGTAEENKRLFDRLCRNVIIPRLNSLIEEAKELEKTVSDDLELGAEVMELAETLEKTIGDISSIEIDGDDIAEVINNLKNIFLKTIIDMSQQIGDLGRLDFFATSVVNALNYLYDIIAPGVINYAPKLPLPSVDNLMKIFRIFDVEDQKHRLYICKASFPTETTLPIDTVCDRIYFDPYVTKERFSAFRAKYIDYFSQPENLSQYLDIMKFISQDDNTDVMSLRIKYSTSLDGYVLGAYKNGVFNSIWASDDFKLDGIYYDPGYIGEVYTDLFKGYFIADNSFEVSWLLNANSFHSLFYWEELGAGVDQQAFDVSVSKSGRYSTLTVKNGDEVKSVVIEDGIDGYTPQMGTDYLTEEEIEDLSFAIESKLRAEIVPSSSVKPEFVDSISECSDISKLYVLPDNYIYAYSRKDISVTPNVFDLSNGSTLNARVNSSGAETATDGFALTGYVEIDPSKSYTLTIEGAKIINTYGMGLIACIYNANKGYLEREYMIADNVPMVDGTYTVGLNDFLSAKWAQASYIRVAIGLSRSAISQENVVALCVKIAPENTEKYDYLWQNTNHTFIPSDCDGIISELSETVEENAMDIDFLNKRVFGNVSAVYPDYWDDAVADVVETIKEKRYEAGRNNVSFAFFSDNHQRLGSSLSLIADVMEKSSLPYAFFCGDSISSGYIEDLESLEGQEAKFRELTKAIPEGRFCRALGNHDGYYCSSSGENHHQSWEERYSLFLSPLSPSQNKVFGGDGTYYYVDDIVSKTRFIVLNSVWFAYNADEDRIADNEDLYGFGEEQILWLKDVLLSLPDGYEVAFFSHSPISNNDHSCIRDARVVQGVLNAFVDGGFYEGSYSAAKNPENNCSVSVEFSKPGKIIGWFSGHIHKDRIFYYDAHNESPLKFKCVTITSDANIPYDENEPERDMNGSTGHAVDFVNVNKNTGEVFIKRLGVGSSRMYFYK